MGRGALVGFVADETSSPMAILGAAISFVRVNGGMGGHLAQVADEAIVKEVSRLKREKGKKPASPIV